ncbi:major facilitator superfamily transporter [Botrytis cinerea]
MAFGILEPVPSIIPSGTNLLENLRNASDPDGVEMRLILVPKPSDSPLDPLNWPRYKKEFLFATIVFGACAAGSLGPVLVPGFTVVATLLDVHLTDMALLNGSLIMTLGVSAYLCPCIAEVYGKRMVYLVTTIIIVAGCCWAGAANSYNSLLAARAIQGLGMGGFYAMAGTASITDVFFVHERGRRIGLWNFSVMISNNLTPIVSGYVISSVSWHWSFWLLAILWVVILAATLACFPETTFYRNTGLDNSVEVDISGDNSNPPQEKLDKSAPTISLPSHEIRSLDVERYSQISSWKYHFGFGAVKFRNQSRVFKLCLDPIILLAHPAVLWGCLMWSVVFTWIILIGAVVSQIFGAEPYNMSTTAVGNLAGIAPLIGSTIGTLTAGWACDKIVGYLALRNRGMYEPEFRLLIIIPAFIAMAIGGFGLGAAIHKELSPVTCGVFMAILNFAVGAGCTGVVAYTNDVCGQRSGEAFGLAMIIKSAFAFGLTFVFNDYYSAAGPLKYFSTFTALTLGIMLTTIPMYVFGKRIRAWADTTTALTFSGPR